MYRTNDPLADFDRYSAEQEEWLENLPKCSECGNPIQDDTCYQVNDELICESCMDTFHKVHTDDFI